MKFGKVLSRNVDGMPENLQELFLRYKQLKKQLKHLPREDDTQNDADIAGNAPSGDADVEPSCSSAVPLLSSEEERAFIDTLNEDVSKLNDFFIEKEEESIIRLQALVDRLAMVKDDEAELAKLRAALVDFHGEMVLLLHWSLLNYAALVKILKKHDKRTGNLLRGPFLAAVSTQPFYSTNGISKLLKSAEHHVQLANMELGHTGDSHHSEVERAFDLATSQAAPLLKQTQVALGTWQQLVSTASTPSTLMAPKAKKQKVEESSTTSCQETAPLPGPAIRAPTPDSVQVP